MESSTLVRAVFALLLVATVAALFIAQSLKTEIPLVLRFGANPRDISPNSDRVRDVSRVGFDLSEAAEVSFSIIDSEGTEVRRLVNDRQLAGSRKYRFLWNGRDDDGDTVPDGTYRLRVVRRKEGRVVDSIKEVRVDTRPPKVAIASVEPNVIVPGGPREVRIRYRGPLNKAPEFRVFRTDDDVRGPARLFRSDESRVGVWDGTVRGGALAPEGSYSFNVKVRDLAGNKTEAPAPAPDEQDAPPRTGVAVRSLTLQGPLGVVPAGSLAVLRVGPRARRFAFTLLRLGSRRAIRRERARGDRLRVRIPRDARTGVYLVRVRVAGGGRAVWPLAVAGLPPRGTRRRPRPVVVLPAVTWQGTNEFDSDLDGFADTLDEVNAVSAERPFARGDLPLRFRSEVAPLLRFLDRERLPYDLTTDLSLARREGPAIGNAPGVAIAGTSTWLPRRVRDRLLAEVKERGLAVASFGRESLRRTVALDGDVLRNPSPPRPDDLFGERTSVFDSEPPAPLREEGDRLGLFGGVDSLFGEFSLFERSDRLPPDAELLTSAGREEGEPAFVGYRLGKGTVVRPGTPQWARQLEESDLGVEVPNVTERIWALLSRRR